MGETDTPQPVTAVTKTATNTILLYVLIGIGIAILGLNLFSIFGSTPPAPNQNLIQYMEAQRKHNDSIEAVYSQQYEQYTQAAKALQQADSASNLQLQNRLVNSINDLKHAYENIPSYVNLSNDSLRRIFATRFGN